MVSITEKQRKAEEREYKKVVKMIERKDTKALDRWTKAWIRQERREEKRHNKSSKKDWL